jgi:hypothetical protein
MEYGIDPKAQKFYAFLSQWIGNRQTWAYDVSGWMMTLKSVDTLTAELMSEVELNEIDLAGLFRGPDGELIETVVGWVLPWPESVEFKLLVDAITAAAKAKQKNQRGVAAEMTLIAGALLYAIFSSSE